jgi:hypothetical protein
MHAGIGKAPEPPGLRNAERPRRVGQMLVAVPCVKRGTFGWIDDGGADDEKGCGRWLTSS